MATIHQMIATINPGQYYKTSDDKMEAKKQMIEFKELIAKDGFQKAAEKAKPKPLSEHKLVYDSSSETLEPVYFFILDLMNDMGLAPEKIFDNFTSSPGSGHFSELGQRGTVMQQQAAKVMGDINNVMRSILNLVYDLKEFKIRLASYEELKSQNKEKKEAALLSLKQIWMDKVDFNKGNSSLKAMAMSQVGFQTLIDAFLFARDEKHADTIDLNERVKRIVKQRINEFNLWLKESERELRKRYEMERKYLKSQVNSVKLYSRWAKPYLRAASQLEMKDNSKNPALIKTFNTILLELTLLGKSSLNVLGAVESGELSKDFKKVKTRGYNSCIVVEFNFRGIPQKTSMYQQHYVFGGRAEVTFTAYALNDDELKKLHEELDNADVNDALKLMEGATTGSLDEMQADIDEFLKEEDKAEKKVKEKRETDMSNPFMALLGFYNPKSPSAPKSSKPSGDKKPQATVVKPDDFLEKTYLRPLAGKKAEETTFNLFDIYKKAHGMPSYT